jgi:drug/metabolite transporter (DMT)-like permease
MTIVFTFLYSKRAGLNIGIATSIWSLNPFMTAVLDRFVYGSEIKRYHVVGMSSLVICAVLVSMSELFITSTQNRIDSPYQDKPPIVYALLISFLMPTICALFTLIEKYVVVKLGVSSSDWAFGHWFLMSVIMQTVSAVYFKFYSFSAFDFQMWTICSLGSLLNCVGSSFVIAAFATQAPIGPILALLITQTIVVTVVQAVMLAAAPNWMQLLGLAFGITGAFILTVPGKMKSIANKIIPCNS